MRKVEKICIFSFIGVMVASLVAVPLGSYISYNNYLNEANANKPSTPVKVPKPVLQSIEAKLVEGKKFYANNLARVVNADVVVTAHYLTDGVESSEVIDPEKYTVSVPTDFALAGGDITVTFGGKSAKIPVTLIKVVAESIIVSKQPYKIKYQQGSTFNGEGMEIIVVYNDGSKKVLSEDQYTYDTSKVLSLDDKKVTVTYNDGENNKTVDVKIEVVATLNDGKITSIEIPGNSYVEVGQNLKDAAVDVLGLYESGNRKHLQKSEYSIVAANENARLGKSYSVEVKYNETIKTNASLIVRNHLEGENGKIVGGKANAETEYLFENGSLIEQDHKVSFAGGFSQSVLNGKEASVAFNVESYTDNLANITMRCGNSYLVKENNQYYMKPLQINSILDMTINGKIVEISDDVLLKGCGPSLTDNAYAPLYGVYYEFTFEGIQLSAGDNEIKISFKNSTLGEKNCWNESPSSMNIDYLNIDTLGSKISENAKIKSIAFSKEPDIKFGTQISTLELPIVATLDNNQKVLLDKNQYSVSLVGGEAGLDYVAIGSYKLKVTLKDNASISIEKDFEIGPLKIEAEDATLTGKRVTTASENEYILKNGEYIPNDVVSYVKGMDYGTTHFKDSDGGLASLSFTFNAVQGKYSLKVRLDNAYYFEDGTDAAGKYYTKDLDLTQVLRIKVNGTYVNMNNVVLPGIKGTSSADHLWMYFYEEVLADFDLQTGTNTVVIEGNENSTLRNRWGEIPVPRFDWIELNQGK